MALKQAFSTTDGVTDLLYVATNIDLCCKPIPESFEVVIPDSLMEPFRPQSLDEAFGEGSGYEYSDLYIAFYDKESNTWKNYPNVNMIVQADVQLQLQAIAIYDRLYGTYSMDVDVQKDVQWRKKVAQALIDACAEEGGVMP